MTLKPRTHELLESRDVRHGFFTRKGGVSKGVYESLNCGPGSNDDRKNVFENRARVAAFLTGKPGQINTLYQCHSRTLVLLEKPLNPENPIKADALMTREKGLILGVLTADCAPILFSDPKAGIIAAAHAGWRGALDEVIENVVANMIRAGSSPEDIRAVIGPCIGQDSYEVQPDFREKFIRQRGANEKYFRAGKNAAYHFSLEGFCLDHLKEAGLVKISALSLDTYSNQDEFFSFRRTTHRQEADYGRQISAIVML